LITCNRCGKENQDHYKFCLGCGNELAKAPVAAPSAAVAATAIAPPQAIRGPIDPITTDQTPLPIGVARTEPPPGPITPMATTPQPLTATSGEIKSGFDQAPAPSPLAAKAKSGIPWNDSPKMPAQLTPPPSFQLPSNPLAAGAGGGSFSPGTAHRSAGVPSANPVRSESTPTAGSAAASPSLSSPFPTSASSVSSGASLPPAADNACPSCGKVNGVGFAFCGTCGTRLARSVSGASAVLAAPRTMFMAPPVAAAAAPAPRGRLVLIRPDGSEGGVHPLHDGENMIGRGQGVLFDSDAYLSPRHGEFSIGPNGNMTVRDLKSLNGVFLKITQEETLESGDIFRIGQELLRFEVISAPQPLEDGTEIMGTPNPGFWGRLSVVVGRDVDGSAFPLFGDAIVLGRERGDILFPEDGYVSGAHARISLRDGQVYFSDLGSSNGSFLRIRGERTIPAGSFVLMGQQLFRTELS
jgi:pSer/pThr/pTyr-binding forkhead associated (FHA) protein